MPLTYVSHQVPAFAAKLVAAQWFDGTALALGSMSPDWPFALAGTRWQVNAHSTAGVVLLCVPVTTAAALAVRSLAPVAAAYLPEFPGLPLRRLALLDYRQPPLAMTVLSALAGAWSHVAWDSFTHDGRWGARRLRWLASTHHVNGHPISGAMLAQHGSTVVGGVVGLVLLSRVLRELPVWAEAKPVGWSRVEPAGVEESGAGVEGAGVGAAGVEGAGAGAGGSAQPGLVAGWAQEGWAQAGWAAGGPADGPIPGRTEFWAAVAVGTATGAVWGSRGGWDGRFNIAVLVIRTSIGTAAGAVVGALRARRKLRTPTSA
ncbi:DUF4184 family protein [Cryptosporangium sp. NPDC051539]|uniref:DUF4184 family protein n=1 Tax=Cryptosporangium sp. NPDC051539 TaxID=3363962 RepID=UPI0037AC0671